ncbi:Protein of unknown function [Paenibacillus algorifonticola]|uniref:DUF3102 domain-containing protein n=1 Tax=Paenibacillus algorifonticola TaxID=684063 RepID=A0A1I2AGM9_9BACL|nr:DUF3102 domain-containing protein [Paenibacillus algorifonticola]SFE42867.1 Protein of unknown function [Paenibacillus algorifonticola]
MNIVLSNDLNIITAEINSYKQVAGQSLFEIGKRLKHVKENDLAHGQWESWLNKIDLVPQTARKFVQAYEQFGNRAMSSDLPTGKLFEMLSLPESVERSTFIQEPHTVPSTGESKTVDEMTVRELREVKQALKAAEKENAAAEQRARQSEATQQEAARNHMVQQNKLLAQIKALEQNPSRSEEDESHLRELTEENVRLMNAINTLKQEMLERDAATEKRTYDLRKMKESLSKTRAYVEVDMSTALNHFLAVSDQREAVEAAELFWANLNDTLNRMRQQWSAAMKIELEVLGDGKKQTSHSRQTVIIEHDSGA